MWCFNVLANGKYIWLKSFFKVVNSIFHCSFLQFFFSIMPSVQQGELFDLSPATSLLSQAVVLGDRRTYSVYDLTRAETFGQLRSFNLLLRWKGDSGMNEFNRWCPNDASYPYLSLLYPVKITGTIYVHIIIFKCDSIINLWFFHLVL